MVLIEADLVPYLRRGIRSQFGFAAERLAVCLLEFDEDPSEEYGRALRALRITHKLYAQLKITNDQPPADIKIDLSTGSALFVLKALQCQYNAELDRLEEAKLQRRRDDARRRVVRRLGNLVVEVRRHIDPREIEAESLSAPLFPQVREHGRGRAQIQIDRRPSHRD